MSSIAKERGFGKWMSGRKLSEETKAKIREKCGWKKVLCKNCAKEIFGKNKYKRKFCSCKCFAMYRGKTGWKLREKGTKLSIEYRKSISGENSKLWRGGRDETTKIRRSLEYRLWREAVFARDNWTCKECSARSKKGKAVIIEAHHIKPFATHKHLRLDINNGITLCRKCHSKKPKGRQIL